MEIGEEGCFLYGRQLMCEWDGGVRWENVSGELAEVAGEEVVGVE